MSRLHPLFPVGLALWALFVVPDGHAVEYSLNGGMSLGGLFNSNIQMLEHAKSQFGFSANGMAALKAKSENWAAYGNLRLENYFYTPDSNINRQNQYLDFGGDYRTERSAFQLAGNFIDDYLLAAENALITGNVLGKVHRTLEGVSPSWTYALSELDKATLGYSFTRTDYEYYIPNYYPNADTHALFGRFSHQYSEQWNLFGDISFTDYIADATSSLTLINNPFSVFNGYNLLVKQGSRDIKYVNFSMGARYDYDSTLFFQASAGAQYSHTASQTVKQYLILPDGGRLLIGSNASDSYDTAGPIFSLSAQKAFDLDRYGMEYVRQITPSINGLLTEVDRLSLTGRHEIQPRLVAGSDFTYTHQKYPNASSIGNTNVDALYSIYSYIQVGGDLTYFLTEQWSVSATYRFMMRLQSASGSGNSGFPNADNQQFYLTINYNFDPYTF